MLSLNSQAVLDLADPGLQEALLACLRALLCHVVSGAPAAAGGTTSSAVAGRASTSSLGGAAAGRESQGGGFLGKGLLRLAMHCLMHLTVLLPVRTWSEAWVQVRDHGRGLASTLCKSVPSRRHWYRLSTMQQFVALVTYVA